MPQKVFFDINVGGAAAGKIVFELDTETVPKTCENFRALCAGDTGKKAATGQPLHFKGSKFHRIIPGFMCQGGDFTTGDGRGGSAKKQTDNYNKPNMFGTKTKKMFVIVVVIALACLSNYKK